MKKIIFAALLVVVLSGCSGGRAASPDDSPPAAAQETISVQESASSEASEETTSADEAVVSEEGAQPSVPDIEAVQNTASSPAVAGSGMVSSANPYATRVGTEILAEGGNAFDAAVAVAAALNVAEPMMSGIGGYGAIVIYDAEAGETRFLDTGSRTPEALDPSALRAPTPNFIDNRCGAGAVVAPGNLNAWERMSEDYGEMEWRRLFEPAIELADEGVVLDGVTAGWIDAAWPAFPANARIFYGNDGVPLRAGDALVQEDLANSFGLIAEEGAGVLYEGALAGAIDASMQENGGFLSLDDLSNNQARWRDTISMDHRGYEVVTASPPSTSWNSLLRLGVMGQFDLNEYAHNSAPYLHTVAEVNKQASQAARNYAADPEIAETPLDLILSQEFLAEAAAQVNPFQAAPNSPTSPFGTPTRCIPQSYQPTYGPADAPATATPEAQSHTTHFVIADEEGNVVSATQTLGNIFGSKVMPEGTGIWLNDAIAWSRFEPAGNVFDAFPGRQSLYALCPTIVMSDGRPYIALGTPGGRTIPQTTPQMLTNLIDFDMDVQQAISAPRISFASPNALVVETGIPQSVRGELSALGHNVRVDEIGLGNAHGLTIEYDSAGRPSRFTGGSDPRGVGAAAGY
ncbi:MAG: Gamma-glutamyltranspeptidase @ Glutathione hydrolase [uncultured Rubrobacteraceae bacterium]|uniref:Glutathione hydrolase proenzyme n=1 Tax=uncultured Rubrobacteraceae bacterium TaxID=349277 RepID=A0A6J4QTV1_9ACTN|nr:MAG: Gamma-glutamyltranspeptidase @ Glutathione hydrolase [uncultured Rubrobacteraceae bacterium]